jgi:hypothetical protein
MGLSCWRDADSSPGRVSFRGHRVRYQFGSPDRVGGCLGHRRGHERMCAVLAQAQDWVISAEID